MSDYIKTACKSWGRAKLRIWTGMDGEHVDGWPSVSITGKIRDEREGASSSKRSQHFAEVMTGADLEVNRAVLELDYADRLVMHIHYCFTCKLEVKLIYAQEADSRLSRREYYSRLEGVHKFLDGWLRAKGVIVNDEEAA